MRNLALALAVFAAITMARLRFAVDLGDPAEISAALQAWKELRTNS